MLPTPTLVRLFGREQALRDLEGLRRGRSVIQIVGREGIGKTALVQEYLRAEMEANRIEQVVWIDRPASIQALRQQLASVLPAHPQVFLAQYPTPSYWTI